jgi:hypothetical protein
VGRFLRGRPSSALTSAQSSVRSWPTPSASSGRCQAGPVPRGPHMSASLIRGQKLLRTRPTTAPGTLPSPSCFLCYSPCCPPMKFWPRPAPRCSIQASVSCPSHPFACRLEPSHRLQCAVASHHRCLLPPIAALAGMSCQELNDEASRRLPRWSS